MNDWNIEYFVAGFIAASLLIILLLTCLGPKDIVNDSRSYANCSSLCKDGVLELSNLFGCKCK